MRAEAPPQSARNPLACSVQGPRCHGEHRCRAVLRRSRLVRAYRTSVNPSGVVHAAWNKSAAVVVRLLVERRVQFPFLRVERRKPPLLQKDPRSCFGWVPWPEGGWLTRAVQLNTSLRIDVLGADRTRSAANPIV